jgi:hypothetical protein
MRCFQVQLLRSTSPLRLMSRVRRVRRYVACFVFHRTEISGGCACASLHAHVFAMSTYMFVRCIVCYNMLLSRLQLRIPPATSCCTSHVRTSHVGAFHGACGCLELSVFLGGPPKKQPLSIAKYDWLRAPMRLPTPRARLCLPWPASRPSVQLNVVGACLWLHHAYHSD